MVVSSGKMTLLFRYLLLTTLGCILGCILAYMLYGIYAVCYMKKGSPLAYKLYGILPGNFTKGVAVSKNMKKFVSRVTEVLHSIPRASGLPVGWTQKDDHPSGRTGTYYVNSQLRKLQWKRPAVISVEHFRKNKHAVMEIQNLLLTADLTEADWKPFEDPNGGNSVIKNGGPKGFVRNVIYEDKQNFILKLLVWASDAHTPIHSHGGSECFVKVVDGKLTETQYNWDREQTVRRWLNRGPGKHYTKAESIAFSDEDGCMSTYSKGQVTSIDDSVAVHKVENSYRDWAQQMKESGNQDVDTIKTQNIARSLHLYVPNFSDEVVLSEWTVDPITIKRLAQLRKKADAERV